MAASGRVRVALVNDYEVVVRGLHAMLQPFDGRIEVVELDASLPVNASVDVTLYDTFSETQVDSSEIDVVLDQSNTGAIAVYTWNMHPQLVEVALAKGCRGYLDKSLPAEELVSAIERMARGDVVVSTQHEVGAEPEVSGGDWPGRGEGLSPRESEVIALITQGLTNADIAARSYLSINSVKTYVRTAYRKMDVSRRSQAVLWGLDHGMLPDRVRVTHPVPQGGRAAQAGTKTTAE
ncbi:response regulator transcription factor [Ornithinimicrobium cerasi]|uniref:response regulator transcription factor n=1 Tax=Ornithinimicrobium cerasi TaxID=2248773 RepID=UPI000EFDBF89|nr:response regulator transcription factor [Ornithinimicrobium cerasi]